MHEDRIPAKEPNYYIDEDQTYTTDQHKPYLIEGKQGANQKP